MNYLSYLNKLIREHLLQTPPKQPVVVFGQNISRGSCLSGLTRQLPESLNHIRVLNTPNCENTLSGMGLGLLLNQVSSVFFMKQLDFLLLGVDHLVNTYNILRNQAPAASFTIFPIVVDIGYQGPQSSFNNLTDLCSLAMIPGYTPNTQAEADAIFNRHFLQPGFRILAVSQRLFGEALLTPTPIWYSEQADLFQYSAGADVCLLSFNFALSQALQLQEQLAQRQLQCSLFNATCTHINDWKPILKALQPNTKIVLIDDSKRQGGSLEQALQLPAGLQQHRVLKRQLASDWFVPNAEIFSLDPVESMGLFD